jgi:hypothetical protein
MLGESRRQEFEKEALNYIDFYMDHMNREDTLIIPEALKLLTDRLPHCALPTQSERSLRCHGR